MEYFTAYGRQALNVCIFFTLLIKPVYSLSPESISMFCDFLPSHAAHALSTSYSYTLPICNAFPSLLHLRS